MGIAGFFLWLKQFYSKCIDNIPQAVVDAALQHKASPNSVGSHLLYDNLYIDMNGLLHPCCHDTFPLPEPKSEEEMFSRLFDQLDLLVKVVRPRKCLVLCVDGVAPRSKMNQQRTRRFHGVEERAVFNEIAETTADAIEKELGLPRPEVRKKWDHNVITPSTAFMDRMGQAVEWYIMKKLNEDPDWRHLTVVYSDAHVPGEGEHKIMQYIRGLRSQPGYHPNTSHVIHGMDADLICLGLSLHEEHVHILRNQLTETFQPDHERFCYFNLHVYREALREDFANIQDMDFERVLDDFVYLCFFVGNDFLPHVPLISIKTQGIELLLDHYVRDFDAHGYLTKEGDVNFPQLSTFLKSFEEKSMQKLKMAYHGVERARRRATTNVEERVSKARQTIGKLKQIALAKAADEPDNNAVQPAPKQKNLDDGDDDGDSSSDDIEESGLDEAVAKAKTMSRAELANCILSAMTDLKKEQARFVADVQPLTFSYLTDTYREGYYKAKFGWDAEEDPEDFERQVHKCCAEYLRGTQWVMWYYTKGCPSWEWYYPYHYAPLLQDLAAFEGTVDVVMNMSAPLHPVEQLLAVLPRESVHGLPEALHAPVLNHNSVLGCFYPSKVDVDYSEANFSYQGVLRLPFIDCNALHEAVDKIVELEPDRAISLVFCHERSALARQVRHLLPEAALTAAGSQQGDGGGSWGSVAEQRRRDDELNDKALVPISEKLAGRVPIAGRIGPCPLDRSWPMHAKITCPDERVAAECEYGSPIDDNKVCCFRYEVDHAAEYRSELLGPGGTARLQVDKKLEPTVGRKKHTKAPAGGNGEVSAAVREAKRAKRARSPTAALSHDLQPKRKLPALEDNKASRKQAAVPLPASKKAVKSKRTTTPSSPVPSAATATPAAPSSLHMKEGKHPMPVKRTAVAAMSSVGKSEKTAHKHDPPRALTKSVKGGKLQQKKKRVAVLGEAGSASSTAAAQQAALRKAVTSKRDKKSKKKTRMPHE